MVTMAERMATIETDIKYIKETIKEFIVSADKRYASKLTERIVYSMVGAILLAFLSKMLGYW